MPFYAIYVIAMHNVLRYYPFLTPARVITPLGGLRSRIWGSQIMDPGSHILDPGVPTRVRGLGSGVRGPDLGSGVPILGPGSRSGSGVQIWVRQEVRS
jgi:hypothetical protein